MSPFVGSCILLLLAVPLAAILCFHSLRKTIQELDMLTYRMKDLESEKEYARYQVEERKRNVWRPGMIYACPPEKFSLLLKALNPNENQRLRRVHTRHADLAMITDEIITTVVP